MKIAARMAPYTKLLIKATWILTYPISKALDYFIGEHNDNYRFKNKDLKTLIELHELKSSLITKGGSQYADDRWSNRRGNQDY